tara:strand:+ start:128858 stop:129271 length:414 start_codon:yes stop_codon:yes gene_type:complete
MKPSTFVKFFFILWTLAEISVFILVGKAIGVGWTLLLIIATTMLGFIFMRDQGFQMMQQFAQRVQKTGRGAEPSDVMEGSFIFIGGMLLIIPGFIGDAIGLLCLIPFVRHHIVKWIILATAKPAPKQGNTYDQIDED